MLDASSAMISKRRTPAQVAIAFLQQHTSARYLFLLISWVAVWYLSGLVEYTEHASIWFPPAGLTFAIFLIKGWRAIPIIMVAAVIATLWTNTNYDLNLTYSEQIVGGLYFGVAHIIPYFAGSRFFRWLTQHNPLSLPHFIVGFLLVAGASSLVATFTVILALIEGGMMPSGALQDTWVPFWIGDMAGVIILAPLFVMALAKIYPKVKIKLADIENEYSYEPSASYKYKLLLSCLLIVLTMLLSWYNHSLNSTFAIFFLVIPQMWIACTEPARASFFSLGIGSLLIVSLVHVLGLIEFGLVYQYAINVIAACALFAIATPVMALDNDMLRLRLATDSLTQVASREHIIKRGKLELQRSQWDNSPLSMLVFDVDHFKEINDKFGHRAGDTALKELCVAAQKSLRPSDTLGRYGGDEFIVILPNTDQKIARQIGTRIMQQAANLALTFPCRLTISVGLAQMDTKESFDSLFERADKALYLAKQAGRNCINSSD
ncbi:sensor domain-containing diguanylate cyclase [Neptunicella marina]|uniref:diguanylate cyclase n=1 Tax=Neptunicella marina TaxID=2125989 RepID=A0A8J6IRQ7_9ALTE|nr:diguanylate cyclase [Neptunicella marina]MBC3765059.1 sensor domain-containing diguanylate cyclase [Neptunicella marina]